MSRCGNYDCQYHKYCESGLMWYDEDITECRHWIKPKPIKMKNIKVVVHIYLLQERTIESGLEWN